jgi:type IX secretion system substrate protein
MEKLGTQISIEPKSLNQLKLYFKILSMTKNIVFLVLFLATSTVSLCQEGIALQSLLERLEGIGDTGLSLKQAIRNYFNTEEQDVLFEYFETQENSALQLQASGDRNFFALDAQANIFGTMPLDGPFNLMQIGPQSGEIYADDFDDQGILYGVNNTNKTLVTIDTQTGAATIVGPLTNLIPDSVVGGLSFDHTSGIMYALGDEPQPSNDVQLYIVNTTTGELTLVGEMGGVIVPAWLVIDNFGNAWAGSLFNDRLWSIDLSTGMSTSIGSFGININFAQDATIDPNTNILYMAAYISQAGVDGIYAVDTTTGLATLIGPTGQQEFIMLSLSSEPLNISESDLANIILYPNPVQDVLFIKTQEQIETIKIYTLQGNLIKEATLVNEVNVSNLASGMYFIQLSSEGKTVTKKFIKE